MHGARLVLVKVSRKRRMLMVGQDNDENRADVLARVKRSVSWLTQLHISMLLAMDLARHIKYEYTQVKNHNMAECGV